MTAGGFRAGLLALCAGAVLCVLLATLGPGGTEPPRGWATCLACGELATAEAVQNVLLFVPFGFAFTVAGARVRRVVLAGALLSLAVELVQHRLPGRDPSLGDLLFNTLGTGAGALVALTAPRWIERPLAPAAWLSLAAALGAAGLAIGSALLLQPPSGDRAATMRWVPDLLRLPRYFGTVTAVRLGPTPLAPGPVPDPARAWDAWLAGAPLEAAFVAGPPSGAFAPIVSLHDARGERLLMIGAAGRDLALWPRTRAAAWRLDQPDLRLRDALAGVARGDTVRVTAVRRPDGYCLSGGGAHRCGLRYRISQAWTLVRFPESTPPWLQGLLGFGWMAALAWPVGLWARRHAASLAALGVLAAGVIGAPPLLGLGPVRPLELAGTAAGILLGARLRGPLYSTVTLLARLRGLSTSHPRSTAM